MSAVDRPAVRFRRASVEDCLAVAEVNVRSWQESFADGCWHPDPGNLSIERRAAMFRRRFDASFYRIYVAESTEQHIVGFADVGDARDAQWNCDAELYSIYVLRSYQRSGVGQRLFELACDAALAARRKSMFLIALEDNPYRKFYERLDGRLLARRAAGTVRGQDAHVIYGWSDLRQHGRCPSSSAESDSRQGRSEAQSAEFAPSTMALLAVLGGGTPLHGGAVTLDEGGWRAFVRDSFRQGVAPMVWDELRRNGRGCTVPSWAMHDLERCYFRTRLDNLRLYGRLAEVLERFASARVEAIVLKGAHLAAAVYKDRALRSMSDIDLLVRRDELADVVVLMQEDGWQQPAAPGGDSVPGDGHQLSTFVRDGVQIEIHWNIEDDRSPFAIDVGGLWQRSRIVHIAQASARVLAPEDLLLHVCLHGSYNHGWLPFSQGLRPLRDVTACIARFGQDLDWSLLVRRAHEWRVNRCAWLCLVLVRDLVSVGVPETAIAELAPREVDWGVVRIARQLIVGDHYGDVVGALPVLGRARLTSQWRHLWWGARLRRHFFPSAKSLASAYPSLQSASTRTAATYAAHFIDLGRDVVTLARSHAARSIVARDRNRLELIDWLESRPVHARGNASTDARPSPPIEVQPSLAGKRNRREHEQRAGADPPFRARWM